MGTALRRSYPPGASASWRWRVGGRHRTALPSGRGRRKEKKQPFSNNPMYLFVNTDSFKVETLVII